eukprot:431933_1
MRISQVYMICAICTMCLSCAQMIDQPTQSPSNSATYLTSTPTLSPTLRVSCGSSRWCYYIDVYPGTSTTYTMVAIQDAMAGATAYFDIYFQIKGMDCVNPAIVFIYEQIDISTSTENIIVYSNSGSTIRDCQGNGGSDSQCGTWWTCLSDYPLPETTKIFEGNSYKVTLVQGSGTNALCSSHS